MVQLVGGDKPLGLVAYVDEYLVAVYADDVALDDVPVLEIYEDALVYGDDLPVLFPKEVLHGQLSGRVLCGVSHETVAFLYFAGRVQIIQQLRSCQRSAISKRLTAEG